MVTLKDMVIDTVMNKKVPVGWSPETNPKDAEMIKQKLLDIGGKVKIKSTHSVHVSLAGWEHNSTGTTEGEALMRVAYKIFEQRAEDEQRKDI